MFCLFQEAQVTYGWLVKLAVRLLVVLVTSSNFVIGVDFLNLVDDDEVVHFDT